MGLFKNKKGDVPSLFLIIVFLVIFAFLSMLMYSLFNRTSDILRSPELADFENAEEVATEFDTASNGLDVLNVVFLIGAMISVIITAFFVRTSPIFLVVSIIVLVIMVFLSMGLSNIYYDITQNETTGILENAHAFPATQRVMNYLPLWLLMTAVMVFVALYAKRESG